MARLKSVSNRMYYRLATFLILMYSVLNFTPSAFGQQFVDKSDSLGIVGLVTSHEWGNGMSVYDFDQDGRDDLSFCSNAGPMLFYRNTEAGFVASDLGINGSGMTKHLLWVDFDNDGLLDVFLTTLNGRCKLYRNIGGLTFEDVTQEAGLPMTNDFNTGASFGDYDRDGFLDLYLCRYVLTDFNPNNPNQYNKLFRNNGDGSFIDVTESSGIVWPPTLAFQGVWMDYNNDHWPDLHLIVDRDPPNRLFKNNGNGSFTDVTDLTNMAFEEHDIMSNSVADFNNDGYLDVFMTNTGASFNFQTPSKLAVNVNGEFFSESAAEYGVQVFDFGWGALWVDGDNDGWQDLYFATPDNNSNYYFKNNGGVDFTHADSLVSVPANYTTFSPAKGDFNNDGFYDIAVQSRTPHHPYMLMNQGGENNYIKMTLSGLVSNTFAIGTWIKLYSNGNQYVHYTLNGENYHGQNSQHLIFGLGSEVAVVDSVILSYSSGHIDTYYDLPVNSAYDFQEGETLTVNISSGGSLSMCQDDTIQLDAGVHNSYHWSTGATTQIIHVSEAGSYAVTVTNDIGITASDTNIVTVFDYPVVFANVNDALCFGDSTASIVLENLTPAPSQSVIWNNDLSGDSISAIIAGAYSYIYTDTNGCSTNGVVSVSQPEALMVISNSSPEIVGDNGSIVLAIFGGTAPYEIYLNNESVSSSLENLTAGTYTFEIIDVHGCTSIKVVEVAEVLSTISISKLECSLLPNPTRDYFQIENCGSNLSSVSVANSQGQQLLHFSASAKSRFDVSDLPEGIYFVNLIFQNQDSKTVKLIRSR